MDINSFLETALWSTGGFNTTGDDYEDYMLDSKFSIDDVSQDFKDQCQAVMDNFMDKARHLFTDEELETGHIEHDLWLTINHHGAGFWDGDYVNGDEITDICKTISELEDDLRDNLYRNE